MKEKERFSHCGEMSPLSAGAGAWLRHPQDPRSWPIQRIQLISSYFFFPFSSDSLTRPLISRPNAL
jgi:hypothetical protein